MLFALWRPGSPTREKPISVDGLNSVKISGTFLDILYPAGFESGLANGNPVSGARAYSVVEKGTDGGFPLDSRTMRCGLLDLAESARYIPKAVVSVGFPAYDRNWTNDKVFTVPHASSWAPTTIKSFISTAEDTENKEALFQELLLSDVSVLSSETTLFQEGVFRRHIPFHREGVSSAMCRLFAVTSEEPLSPMMAIGALDVMREGHDGSGVGLFLGDLGGPFEELKGAPILSGIFTNEGIKRLDQFMMNIGFMTKYKLSIRIPKTPPPGVPRRDMYLIRAYEYPEGWENLTEKEIEHRLLMIRLQLRQMGEEKEDMIVYSFWPDVIMIKEIGDPLTVAEYLKLDREELQARIILAQGRQNTNYAINLYACHPFFIQGIATMTNGENTAFVPIREFLASRGFPGYIGYQSDSEVFTHILHFSLNRLGLGIESYKHVITPLQDEDLEQHPNGPFLKQLKNSCRRLIIDGPNCVIGCLPDKTIFIVQDRKKLRPGVVGGRPGLFAISSEMCGLDAAIPDRNKSKDFQPMHLDTAIIRPDRQEVTIWSQMDPLPLQH